MLVLKEKSDECETTVRSQQLDFTPEFNNLTVWNEKLTLRLVFPAQLLLDYFKEFETNTVTHSAAQTFRNNRSAALSCLAPRGSDKWKVPIFILGLYRKWRWNVGQRRWGSNPLISADMCEALCMEMAPGQRCRRLFRVKDCGRGNLMWPRCSVWTWQSWFFFSCSSLFYSNLWFENKRRIFIGEVSPRTCGHCLTLSLILTDGCSEFFQHFTSFLQGMPSFISILW